MDIETNVETVEVGEAAPQATPQQSGAYVMKKCINCGKPFAVARKIASFTKRCPDCRCYWDPLPLKELDRKRQKEARERRNANLAEYDKRCPPDQPVVVEVVHGVRIERRGKVPVGAYAVSVILHS